MSEGNQAMTREEQDRGRAKIIRDLAPTLCNELNSAQENGLNVSIRFERDVNNQRWVFTTEIYRRTNL